IVVPDDGILPVGAYYLHDPLFATDEESPYPVTPNFHHWEFPHDNVPSLWLEGHGIQPNPSHLYAISPGTFRDKVLVRDESCRMTLARGGVEQAHWVPISADDWFNDNTMKRYHSEETAVGVRDVANTILLRSDVHKIWDSKDMTFVPKRRPDGTCGLVMHMLSALHAGARQEKLELWHNRQPHTLYGIRPEFVFARFAWTIFNNRLFCIFNSKRPQGWRIRVREDDPTAETYNKKKRTRAPRVLLEMPCPLLTITIMWKIPMIGSIPLVVGRWCVGAMRKEGRMRIMTVMPREVARRLV
ncbi:hypothetical protein F5Y00DRAFT_250221, partial [Daldinia vernicosa]|uniref:uncharacterized protein n=1 Tax=Daldinia vernicosa TaxID=114800 RepID=UPI002007ECF3